LVQAASPAQAGERTLLATVGPDFEIFVKDSAGQRVSHVEPGSYRIEVRDASDVHNFHLFGPNVDLSTGVSFVGTVGWNVTLRAGHYHYQSDPDVGVMEGFFNVGAPSPPAGRPGELLASVGPGRTIMLRTSSGRRVHTVRGGRYRILVRDRSRVDNFHLRGPRIDRKTGVRSKGTSTWTARLTTGVTYRYFSDARPRSLRGSFRVGG
jgi:hypothetical protein